MSTSLVLGSRVSFMSGFRERQKRTPARGFGTYTLVSSLAQDTRSRNRLHKSTPFLTPISGTVRVSCKSRTRFFNIVAWATANNLKPNKLKTKEVVIYDSRRRRKVSPLLPLPDVDRVTMLKVLGVTLNNHMSASEHIHNVLSDSTPPWLE